MDKNIFWIEWILFIIGGIIYMLKIIPFNCKFVRSITKYAESDPEIWHKTNFLMGILLICIGIFGVILHYTKLDLILNILEENNIPWPYFIVFYIIIFMSIIHILGSIYAKKLYYYKYDNNIIYEIPPKISKNEHIKILMKFVIILFLILLMSIIFYFISQDDLIPINFNYKLEVYSFGKAEFCFIWLGLTIVCIILFYIINYLTTLKNILFLANCFIFICINFLIFIIGDFLYFLFLKGIIPVNIGKLILFIGILFNFIFIPILLFLENKKKKNENKE